MRAQVIAATLVLATAAFAADKYKEQDRLNDSGSLLSEIMGAPDKGIPQDLLSKAQCVVVIPGLKKAAFVVGGEYGRGFIDCRKASGEGWGHPAAVKMEGGSFGLQIGGSDTDVVMLVMNRRGMDKLMSDKFTLGADASVAAGPVGRTANASTDVAMSAEILAWSRSKGLFAGLALKGATLRPDKDGNREIYGSAMGSRETVESTGPSPDMVKPFTHELDKYSAYTGADRSDKH